MYNANETQLIEKAETLEIGDGLSNKSKKQKVVLIRKSVESKLEEDSETTIKAMLLRSIIAIIRDTPPPLEISEREKALIALQKDRHDRHKKKQQQEMEELLKKLESA